MKTFKDLKGIEGIDKLNECVPIIDRIFSDKELINEIKEKTWAEASIPMYKKHTEEFNSILEILGNNTDNIVAVLSAVARLLSEVTGGDTGTFFLGACKNVRSSLFAMANIKGEQ